MTFIAGCNRDRAVSHESRLPDNPTIASGAQPDTNQNRDLVSESPVQRGGDFRCGEIKRRECPPQLISS